MISNVFHQWPKSKQEYGRSIQTTTETGIQKQIATVSANTRSSFFVLFEFFSPSSYLEDLVMMFCRLPTSTASMRGVVLRPAASGAQAAGASMSEKNTPPVAKRTAGVI